VWDEKCLQDNWYCYHIKLSKSRRATQSFSCAGISLDFKAHLSERPTLGLKWKQQVRSSFNDRDPIRKINSSLTQNSGSAEERVVRTREIWSCEKITTDDQRRDLDRRFGPEEFASSGIGRKEKAVVKLREPQSPDSRRVDQSCWIAGIVDRWSGKQNSLVRVSGVGRQVSFRQCKARSHEALESGPMVIARGHMESGSRRKGCHPSCGAGRGGVSKKKSSSSNGRWERGNR